MVRKTRYNCRSICDLYFRVSYETAENVNVFWPITSEVKSFPARNFVTFPKIKCKIGPTLTIFEIFHLHHVTWPYLVSGHSKIGKNLT